MRIFTQRKTVAIAVSTVLFLAGAGAVFAYWTYSERAK